MANILVIGFQIQRVIGISQIMNISETPLESHCKINRDLQSLQSELN